jgi:hypothetical protein
MFSNHVLVVNFESVDGHLPRQIIVLVVDASFVKRVRNIIVVVAYTGNLLAVGILRDV